MDKNEQPWFAVRCLFRDDENDTYEERTILVRARDHDEAIRLAEQESREHAKAVGTQYLNYADTFHLFDSRIEHGTEIFSLLRTTKMDSEDYINRFLDSGTERRSL